MLNFTWPMRMEDEAKEVVLQLPDVHEASIIYDETRKVMNADTVEEYLDLFNDYKDVIPAHMTLRKVLEKFDSELYTLFKRVEELEDAYRDWLRYCTSLESGEENDGRGTDVNARELCKMMVRVSETVEHFRRFGCWNGGSLHMKESDLKVIYNVESSQARKLSSK